MLAALLSKSWLHSMWCNALIFTSFHATETNNFPPHYGPDFNLYVCFFIFCSLYAKSPLVHSLKQCQNGHIYLYAIRYNMYKHRISCAIILGCACSIENVHQINYGVGMEWTNQNQNQNWTENGGQPHTKRWLRSWNESHLLANDLNVMLVVVHLAAQHFQNESTTNMGIADCVCVKFMPSNRFATKAIPFPYTRTRIRIRKITFAIHLEFINLHNLLTSSCSLPSHRVFS